MRARCRGGNLLRAAGAVAVQQEPRQPALLVAAADAPDGGAVALQPGGDVADALAGGDGQGDAGVLHLEPGQAAAAGDGPQDGGVRCQDGQRERSSAAHEGASVEGNPQHTRDPNLLHDFVAAPLVGGLPR
jgi:hypothetical protein